jgi:hypothetical protein
VSWFNALFQYALEGKVTSDQRDLRMCSIQESGWEIHHEKRLISHHSGFRAEFRDVSIYSIKQFPYEATIHDIRNWVTMAESLLARISANQRA